MRPIHPEFQYLLTFKERALIALFTDLRQFIFEICPGSNELLYHTHALSAVFSISDRLADAFCHIPVYERHLNLGFNNGTLLDDPADLLTGTGKFIRHIAIKEPGDYRNPQVIALVEAAVDLAMHDMDKPAGRVGQTISKIRKR